MIENPTTTPPDPDAKPQQSRIVTMTIYFDTETDAVQVDGPINNRLLAYGMLQLAFEAIMKYGWKDEVKKNQIVVPLGAVGPVGMPRR